MKKGILRCPHSPWQTYLLASCTPAELTSFSVCTIKLTVLDKFPKRFLFVQNIIFVT
jgi:hypothetical protein